MTTQTAARFRHIRPAREGRPCDDCGNADRLIRIYKRDGDTIALCHPCTRAYRD